MKDATQIVIVLDRSGSMEVVREATIESFNQFMIKQKALPGQASLFLVQFNTEYQVLCDKPLAAAPMLNYLTYQPNGATALYDAVGHTIDSIGQRLSAVPECVRPNKVVFVVITDGLENSSRRYSQQMIAERIEHQRNKYGWEFVFLGANQDAVLTASELNIPMRAAMTYCAVPQQVQATFGALGEVMEGCRAGAAAVFSAEHRARAMGGSSAADPEPEAGEEQGSESSHGFFSWLRRSAKPPAHTGQS